MFAHVGCVKHTTGTWRRASCALRLCWALTIACFVGCGGDRGPERVVVSGAVTYNGEPIPEGTIRFVPDATSSVPTTTALIVDGKYSADGKGGVSVGTYKIQIEAFRKVPLNPNLSKRALSMVNPTFKDGGRQQYIPKRYNVYSQLEITIPAGSGEITENIDLTD